MADHGNCCSSTSSTDHGVVIAESLTCQPLTTINQHHVQGCSINGLWFCCQPSLNHWPASITTMTQKRSWITLRTKIVNHHHLSCMVVVLKQRKQPNSWAWDDHQSYETSMNYDGWFIILSTWVMTFFISIAILTLVVVSIIYSHPGVDAFHIPQLQFVRSFGDGSVWHSILIASLPGSTVRVDEHYWDLGINILRSIWWYAKWVDTSMNYFWWTVSKTSFVN